MSAWDRAVYLLQRSVLQRLLWKLLLGLLLLGSSPSLILAQSPPLRDGLTAEEAAAYMSVPPGFHVSLCAGEPQIHQPIAMAWDDRGRLWIAEAYTYPQRAPEGEGKDRIVILEDRDEDGRWETRTVFAEKLNLVSGLEVGFGGVWIGAAPYLLFIPDRDGDDVPDGPPEVLLDGFGYQDTHETLNAFIWGPDGWLYGCHGVFTHSLVGKPGTPDDRRVPVNAALWRYHPVRHEFDVFARGTSNPWGVDFNEQGHAFMTACVIPHLWHVVQGARYQRQGGQHFNPYVYDDIKTIADHAHYVGDIRDHAWWGKEPAVPADTLAAGGGHAHCGAMIYLADNWPQTYRGHIYMNNIHGNRVNSDLLERHGSGYVGHHGQDLMLANDRWFRGINLKYGPDGSVFVIDWYDRNACHRANPEIWDRTNGRLYNISYGDPAPARGLPLRLASDLQLVRYQTDTNQWYVRMARRLLQERAAAGRLDTRQVRRELTRIVRDSADETHRLQALWTMHVTGLTDVTLFESLLEDPHESVRAWVIQLSAERGAPSDRLLARFATLARTDPSPLVRLYLASLLQRLPLPDRWEIAEGLVTHRDDAKDHNLPLMIWYGIEPLVVPETERSLRLVQSTPIALLSNYVVRRAAADDQARRVVLRWILDQSEATQEMALAEMLQAFAGRIRVAAPPEWNDAYAQLRKGERPELRRLADRLAIRFGDRRVLPTLRHMLSDAGQPISQRQEALRVLVASQDKEAATALLSALDEPRLRQDAIRGLANLDDPRTPHALLELYPRLDPEARRDVISTLSSRASYALALLDATEKGLVPKTDLHAYHVRQIERLNDPHLRERVVQVWGQLRDTSSDKKELIAKYKALCRDDSLTAARPGRGRVLFESNCASCHRLFGQGGEVGPELTGSNRANLDYILENIVDPSAVLGNDYRMTIVELNDGRVVSGLVQKETDDALTIRTLNDVTLVPKEEIDVRSLSPLSMMPDGLLERLKPAQVRDLVAYLASPSQVPREGPPSPIDPASGRVPQAFEAEDMQVATKTEGKTEQQPMGTYAADRWSNGAQLWWTQAGVGDRLALRLPVAEPGLYQPEIVFTRAPDYAIVRVSIDDTVVADHLDLYAPHVLTSGVLSFAPLHLSAGDHQLVIDIVGANPGAIKSYMVGIDFVRLRPAAE